MQRGVTVTGIRVQTPSVIWGTSVSICHTPCTVTSKRRATLPVRMAMVAEPVSLEIKGFDGEVVGTESLSLKVADPEKAKGLVHRYLVKVRRDMRKGNASTKTRAEVRGGGRKPYPQKGTGRARRGSTRSPLIRGGGVAFGPKPRDWSVDMNKKERRLAMATALQSAADDVTVIESLDNMFTEVKTKSLVQALERWGIRPRRPCLLITNGKNRTVYLSGRNVENLVINSTEHLNVYDILRADKIIIEKEALEYVQGFYGPNSEN